MTSHHRHILIRIAQNAAGVTEENSRRARLAWRRSFRSSCARPKTGALPLPRWQIVLAPQRCQLLRRFGDGWSDANILSRLYQ